MTVDAWVKFILVCSPFLHNLSGKIWLWRPQFRLKQCVAELMRRKQGIIQDHFRMKLHWLSHCHGAYTRILPWFTGHICMNDVIKMLHWRTHWTSLSSPAFHHGALSKHIPSASVMCWKIISDLGSSLSEVTGWGGVSKGEISDRARRPRVWFELMNKDSSVFPDRWCCLWQLPPTNPPAKIWDRSQKSKGGGRN